jgi:hypothetical protein
MPVDITLVHGTWAASKSLVRRQRTSRWVEPDSEFRQRLERELHSRGESVRLTTLEWSGSNSFLARAAAEAELRSRLLQQSDQSGVRQILVGHSHGGNIIGRCCQLLRDEGSKCEAVEVVTLATAFISLKPFPWKWSTILALWAGVLAGIVGVLGFLAMPLIVKFGYGRTKPVGMIIMYVVFFAVFAFASWTLRFAEALEAGSLDGPIAARRLLCLRGYSDEASLALAAGAVAAQVARWAVAIYGAVASGIEGVRRFPKWCQRLFVGLLVTCVVLPGPWMIAELLGAGERLTPFYNELYGYWLPLLLRLFAGCGTTAIVVQSLALSILGREMLAGGLWLIPSVESVPDCEGALTVKTLPPGESFRRTLRHSLYEHPDCARVIAEWICQASSPSPESPALPPALPLAMLKHPDWRGNHAP